VYPAPLSPTWTLQEYVRRVQRRLQARTASRGIGLTIGVALLLTVLCVYIANEFAFSDGSVIGGRAVLFGAIFAVIVLALWRPLRELGVKKAVDHAEREVPAFDGRIETYIDQSREAGKGAAPNALLDLLAEDTLQVAESAPVEHVVSWQKMIAFMALAGASFFALIWLGTSGPGYWGYGTSRLWGGWLESNESPYYELRVEPGDATVRRGADLTMTAEVIGFESPSAQVYVKYADSVNWEEAPMRRELEGAGFEFLFAGVRDPFRYYVSAGGIRSDQFEVDVVPMPVVRNLKLNYHSPEWTGLKNIVEDPGGDINAVGGTEVEVTVETDKPLEDGVVTISRALRSTDFPADFMLIAAMNPCPCGYRNDPRRECHCSVPQIERYVNKISGPLLDRIDIHIEVPAVDYKQLASAQPGTSTEEMRRQVLSARKRQAERFAESRSTNYNAQMSSREIRQHCKLDDESQNLLRVAVNDMGLSARAHDKILRTSRTIADLDKSAEIQAAHISEAINYRMLDRRFWT